MNERKTYRVMSTAAQRDVITESAFVAQRLTAWGWKCIATGSQEECEDSVMRSVAGQRCDWTDIPFGAQCVVR